MPLSRLENFLRNPKGTILYVDPNNFDSTDSFQNRGDSQTRPFKTIQRALVEAARFSYQTGFRNDLNDRTTILVSSGVHYIDNRPGLSVTNISNSAVFKKRTGQNTWSVETLNEFSENSNFDIFDIANDLYKFNSTEGGVILPRGTSIAGLDLRKTKIRPLYVPNPADSSVDRSSIFKITGNCYFNSFTFFDADPATAIYNDYTYTQVNPRFSHHKLTAFTYADGVNKVKLGYEQTDLTDLQMYYYKIAKAYGDTTDRGVPDYPGSIDFEPVVDEYRIVGVLEENLLGISSIRSGDGTGSGLLNEITVTTKDLLTDLDKPHNLDINTPILISGISVSPESYNGSFVVKSVVGPNTFTYTASSIPATPQVVNPANAFIKVESDTTSSSSPYIFNCSLRSVYGMCGLWADGSKADGFKSVVVAQFTGISLQKDDNAFLLYSKTSGSYLTNSQLSQDSIQKPLHTNPYSIYRPDYENFHIRVSNNGFIQCVSIFAIGYSKHFVTETGGDMSITNSNSNFGALALESYGFRNTSFNRDDVGYITHIIPPKALPYNEININWLSIDVPLTLAAGNTTKRLYLSGYKNVNLLPSYKIDGYRVGAKRGDLLKVVLGNSSTVYTSPILMGVESGTGVSAVKEYKVTRSGSVNSIASDIISFTENHQLSDGEKVRIFSDTGQVPDGLVTDTVYYVIRESNNSIKLAYNYNDAVASPAVNITGISNNGGILTVVSTVTDKVPGDVAHPIQWDSTENNWYIISSTDSSNQIHTQVTALGEGILGKATSPTYFTRQTETRSIEDRLYKLRYVIPKNYTDVRPPTVGFVLQETKTVGVTTASINSNTNLRVTDKRNEKVILSATAGAISNNAQNVTAKTEAPHNLFVGDTVKVQNVKSTYNTTALGITSTFNGSYKVLSTPDSHTFTYSISGVSTNPGTFINDVNTRNSSTLSALPLVSREQYANNFSIYRVDTIKEHIPGDNGQDGVYHLTIITSNTKLPDSVGYGLSEKKFNQDVRNLYPQTDRDNFVSDPEAASSFADYVTIGKVVTNDKKKSITKEALQYFAQNNNIGFGITNLTVSGIGSTTITIKTSVEHKLNSIKTISLTSGGSGHSGKYYGAKVTIGSTITDAICNYNTSAGAIDASTIEFIDFGSSFSVGQTIGIGTLGGTASITEINSNLNDGLELSGFLQKELNGVFKIVSIPDNKTIVLEHPTGISTYVSNTNSRTPFGFISSKGVGITSFKFADVTSGIVTVTTLSAHGLLEGNNITIVGSGSSIYNSNFIVDSVVGLNTITFKIINAPSTPSSTQGTLFKRTLTPNGLSSGKTGENLGNRASYIYAGITTTYSSITDTQIQLASDSGFTRGDFIQIGPEIIRLVRRTGANTFNIERSMFGSLRTTETTGVVQKIKIIPIELRRPSYLRASGHTFEYLGYGPGNYSTAVPQKQTRKLTDDDVLVSQAREISGGTVVYSGMNDLGEFYSGSKKLNSASGQETIVEAPIITFTGDDLDGSNDPTKLSGIFDSILVRQRLTVEGGDNGTESSIFYGPVRFQNGLTINGDFGLTSLLLGGKKFTTNNKSSTINGTISYVGTASTYIGEIYDGSSWKRWGLISQSASVWDIDLGASSSLKATNINATGTLTINGVTFNGSSISSLNLNSLNVSGISTLAGGIKGTGGVLSITDSINLNGVTLQGSSGVLGVNGRINAGIVSATTIQATTGNITTINATTLNGNLNFTQTGAGAQTRTVSSKLSELPSVLDFIPAAEHAAIINATSTYDCTAAFQAAIAAHKRVYVPYGRYTITSTLELTQSYSGLIGDAKMPIIQKINPADGPAIAVRAPVGDLNEFTTIENIIIRHGTSSNDPLPSYFTGLPTPSLAGIYVAGDTDETYANLGAFPPTGKLHVIYTATNTGTKYRWNGSTYVVTDLNTVPSYNPGINRLSVKNVRILGWPVGMYLGRSVNTLLERVIVENHTAWSDNPNNNNGLTVNNRCVGFFFDCTPRQIAGISPQASIEVNNCIVNGDFAPTIVTSFCFWATGYDVRDIFFTNCETSGGHYGFFIENTSSDWNWDIHLIRPIIDAYKIHGIVLKNINGPSGSSIIGGYAVRSPSGTGTSGLAGAILLENCNNCTISGGFQIYGYTSNDTNDDGIRLYNTKGSIISDCIIKNCTYGISLEGSSLNTITSNQIVGVSFPFGTPSNNAPTLSQAIRVFSTSNGNTITGNVIAGANTTYKYGDGIYIESNCIGNILSGNIIEEATVTDFTDIASNNNEVIFETPLKLRGNGQNIIAENFLTLKSSGGPQYYQGNNALAPHIFLDGGGNLLGSIQNTGGEYVAGSDIKLKDDIKPILDSLEKLKNIQGKSYLFKKQGLNGRRNLGLIAQEIQNIFPEVVFNLDDDTLGISYSSLIPVLINAINELHQKVIDLENRA